MIVIILDLNEQTKELSYSIRCMPIKNSFQLHFTKYLFMKKGYAVRCDMSLNK
jgi:hypothetical protein